MTRLARETDCTVTAIATVLVTQMITKSPKPGKAVTNCADRFKRATDHRARKGGGIIRQML